MDDIFTNEENSNFFDIDPSLIPNSISLKEKNFIFQRLLGFFDLKVLEAATTYLFFDIPDAKPSSVAEISDFTGIPQRSVKFLLLSLIGLQLYYVKDEKYFPTELGIKFFSQKSSFNLTSYVHYLNWLFDALPRFSKGIIEDEPIWNGYNHYLKIFKEESCSSNETLMNDAMNSSQLLLCHRLLNSLDLSAHQKLLDIGGGDGRFSASLISKYPHIRSTIFELPQVCQRATLQISKWNLDQKISTISGDFENDPWPYGYDLISFVRIFTTRSADLIRALLKKAFNCLTPGGRVIFADTAVVPVNQQDIGLLASRLALIYQMSSYGNVRSLDEWVKFIIEAGFDYPELAIIDDPYGFISAVKP